MDAAFEVLWKRYRTWADTSSRLKAVNASWRRRVLLLTILGTALATLGPFARDIGSERWASWLARALPMAGAVALAIATYFGRELLDTKHEEAWTRARGAAEAYKSDASKYLVAAAPYDGADRVTRLQARLAELADATKGLLADTIPAERAVSGMPTSPWTLADYLKGRLDDQIEWYRGRAGEHTELMDRGRKISLSLGGFAVVLSVVTGATPEGATLAGAVLGVITTAGGALGAHFQAGHAEAIALKYRETADTLELLKIQLASAAPEARSAIVSKAESIMQSENAAWLQQLKPVSA